jgi:glycosyltransferase involved in cell wall biosynthesis
MFDGKRFGPAQGKNVLRVITGSAKVLVDRFAWLLADSVVVETPSVRGEVRDLSPTREVMVVSHGIGKAGRSLLSPDPIELLFVGTPGIRKRTHLLPEILYRVRQLVPETRLRIVGFGRDGDPHLMGEARRLGVLESIEFLGPLRSEEVVDYYRKASVLVLPSAYEGLPMVLLEAMREGLPVVAANVSGHPEAIDDGVSGYLFPLDDVQLAAEYCAGLLRDQDVATEMGEHARQVIAERFSLEQEISSYAQLYEGLRTARLAGRSST